METHHETASEGGGASFQYNFSFDEADVDVDPFANSHSMPMPSEQMNNTAGIAELNQSIQINQVQPSPPISDAPIFPSPGTTFSHVLTTESRSPPPQMGNSPQNFMAPIAEIPSYQSSNPSLIHAQNEREATPSLFNSNMSRQTQPYWPIPMHMGVSVQDGVVQPYLPQMEQLPLSLTLGESDHGTNTMMAGLGGINQRPPLVNQQQATLYPQQLDPQGRVWTPQGFWPQHNQVMAANGVVDPQWTNFIPYGAGHMRPQGAPQLMNQPQQLNQVQPLNNFGSQSHYPIQPAELSRSLGPQFSKNNQEINEVMTHNPWVLESSAIAARVQNSPDGQDNQSREVPPHVFDSQHSNSNTPDPFMQSGVQLEEMLNPSTIAIDSSSQRSGQLQNSPTEQQGTLQQEGYYADKQCGKRPESGTSLSPAKRSKRNSAASARTDVNRSIFQSQDKEVEICSNASVLSNPLSFRIMMNSLYDPKYEELGLPIDPHIRLFQLELQENASKKFPPMNR